MDRRQLKETWLSWERRQYPTAEYPPGHPLSVVGGVDLALADGDVGANLHEFFSRGSLGDTNRRLLRVAIRDLSQVISILKPEARSYFKEALHLLAQIDAELRAKS